MNVLKPSLPSRPTFDEWGLALAKTASLRAECTRRRVGAVILDKKKRRTWIGINGAPPGEPSCLDGACPRGRHYGPVMSMIAAEICDGVMVCGGCRKPWPCSETVEPDSSYDTSAGMCISTHAELQCIFDAGRSNLDENCTMYVSERPCPACERIIKGCLKRVVWPGGELRF